MLVPSAVNIDSPRNELHPPAGAVAGGRSDVGGDDSDDDELRSRSVGCDPCGYRTAGLSACSCCRLVGPTFTLGLIALGAVGPILEVWIPAFTTRSSGWQAVAAIAALACASMGLLLWSLFMVTTVHPGPVGRRLKAFLDARDTALRTVGGASSPQHRMEAAPLTAVVVVPPLSDQSNTSQAKSGGTSASVTIAEPVANSTAAAATPPSAASSFGAPFAPLFDGTAPSHFQGPPGGMGVQPLPLVPIPTMSAAAATLRICQSCEDVKPQTAHHCRTCECCIDRLDHHCPWIGQCVGRNNHKHFALFLGYCTLTGILFAASVIPGYGAVSSSGVSYGPGVPTFNILLVASLLVDVLFGLFLGCFFASVMSRAAEGETKLDIMRRERDASGHHSSRSHGDPSRAAAAASSTVGHHSTEEPTDGNTCCCLPDASTLANMRVYFGTGSAAWWWLPLPPRLEYSADDLLQMSH